MSLPCHSKGTWQLLSSTFSSLRTTSQTKAQVIAVFHTNAGHVTLNDKSYNTDRNVATGNPYKALVADLMKRGAHIELCGATAKGKSSFRQL